MEYEPTDNRPSEWPEAPKPRARKAATKKEFLQLPKNRALKICILISAIGCYIWAGLNLIASINKFSDILETIGGIQSAPFWRIALFFGMVVGVSFFYVAMGLSIQKRQSLTSAAVLFLFVVIGIVLKLTTGEFILKPIYFVAILALCCTAVLEKRWKAYIGIGRSETRQAWEEDSDSEEPEAEPTISRKDFLELPENEKLKKRIHTNANICYVLLGVSAVFCAILTAVEYFSVSDLVLVMILLGVILALVIGVHKRQSLACGIALGVIVALSALTDLIGGESRGLSLADLACVGLFVQSIQLEQQRKRYCQKQAQSPGAQPEPNSDPKGETPMKYVCPCGYEYDPAVGDPDNGIAPGTPFEAIPDSWVCPVCGLGKGEFVPA